MEYQYPLSFDWTTEEVVDVIKYFECVEKAYEKGIERDRFMETYRRFKEIVPSKGEEKKICDEFEELSGYSSYKLVQIAKKSESGQTLKIVNS